MFANVKEILGMIKSQKKFIDINAKLKKNKNYII